MENKPTKRLRDTYCLLKPKYRLITLLLLLYSLANAGQVDNTLISLHLNNAPIEQAFAAIKKQTSFRVMYDNSLIKKAKPVTINMEKEKLSVLLDKLFEAQPFGYKVLEKSIVVVPLPDNEKKPISITDNGITPTDTLFTGTVYDDSTGLALAGAVIAVKNTSYKTASDNEGHFKVKVPFAGATLVVSYVGYTDKLISINSSTHQPLAIAMRTSVSEIEMVSVMSTGYQQVPKERSTGSYTFIDNTVLNQQAGSNIINRLNGVANAVLFDPRTSRPPFTIRGLSTINSSANPLIVLDNFPYEGNINNINPNDIESISILKDAAATSIWGARAGNGVIVITTKKSQFNQKTRIEFNSNLTFGQKPALFELTPIASTDMIDVETMLFRNGFYNANINSNSKPALSPAVEILLRRRNGLITAADSAAQIDALRGIDVRNDYERYVYANSFSQQYALNIRGGAEKISYLFSGGYDRNLSELDALYNRLSLRSLVMFKPSQNLTLTTSITFTQAESKSGKSGYGTLFFSGAQRLYPYAQFADADGQSLPIYMLRKGYVDTVGQGKLLDWKYYPLEDYKHNTNQSTLQDLLANFALQYKLNRHISVDLRYQYNRQQSNTDQQYDNESYFARSLINTYSQLNYTTGVVRYIVPNGGILDRSVSYTTANNARLQINFEKQIAKHAISAIAGSEIRQTRLHGNTFRVYGYDENLIISQNVDYVNTYPSIITGSTQSIPNNTSFTDRTNRFVSFFGNAAYTYAAKYTLSASARKDASNLFGVNTNNKWKPLWSVGAAWDIAKESFYSSRLFPYLRTRITYGFSGNVNQNMSAVSVIRYGSAAQFTSYPVANIVQSANPELRWETVRTLNTGIDFRMKNDILFGSIEYYTKNGLDLIGSVPVDYTAGLGVYFITKNVASTKGSGWDISLSSKIVNRPSFKWLATLQFNQNTSKIADYYLSTITGSNFVSSGAVINPIPGKPVYSIMSYEWRGLDNSGNPQGVLNKLTSTNYTSITGTGTTIDDLVYGGPAIPTIFGNFSNTLSFKGFSVTANITYKMGYYFRKESIHYSNLFSQYLGHSDFALRWQKPGDENNTHVPAMIYPGLAARDNFYTNADVHVKKADNIRLAFINCSYEINRKQIRRLPFDHLQLYLICSNLGILWKAEKSVVDPDYGSLSLRPAANITVGLKTTF